MGQLEQRIGKGSAGNGRSKSAGEGVQRGMESLRITVGPCWKQQYLVGSDGWCPLLKWKFDNDT